MASARGESGTGTDEYLGVELEARYGGEFQRRVQVQVQTSTLGLNWRPGTVASARSSGSKSSSSSSLLFLSALPPNIQHLD